MLIVFKGPHGPVAIDHLKITFVEAVGPERTRVVGDFGSAVIAAEPAADVIKKLQAAEAQP
jgi:hypothetical protein